MRQPAAPLLLVHPILPCSFPRHLRDKLAKMMRQIGHALAGEVQRSTRARKLLARRDDEGANDAELCDTGADGGILCVFIRALSGPWQGWQGCDMYSLRHTRAYTHAHNQEDLCHWVATSQNLPAGPLTLMLCSISLRRYARESITGSDSLKQYQFMCRHLPMFV